MAGFIRSWLLLVSISISHWLTTGCCAAGTGGAVVQDPLADSFAVSGTAAAGADPLRSTITPSDDAERLPGRAWTGKQERSLRCANAKQW